MAYLINKSAMPGASVDDMMVILFGEAASVTENRDLGTEARLVDEFLVSIMGPSSPVEQMQGGLHHLMEDLPLNLFHGRGTIEGATRALWWLLGRQISSGADLPL